MNPDVILDFFVDYYLWFIIGGSILLFAVIGFIADKKNLFNKKDKNSQNIDKVSEQSINEPIKNDNIFSSAGISDDESIIKNDSEGIISEKNMNNGVISIVDNDLTNNSTSAVSENVIDNSDIESNVLNSLTNSQQFLEEKNDSFKVNNVESIEINPENTLQDNNENDYYQSKNEEVPGKLDNFINNIDEDINKINNIDENINKINNIDEDINKINNMIFDNDDQNINVKKDDFNYDNNIQGNSEKNSLGMENKNDSMHQEFGDNPDQTIEISYSQLKEMVEDIIAENKNENYKSMIKSEEFDNKKEEGIKDIPLPNLDHLAVDVIRQQDEDEDDVWKF